MIQIVRRIRIVTLFLEVFKSYTKFYSYRINQVDFSYEFVGKSTS